MYYMRWIVISLSLFLFTGCVQQHKEAAPEKTQLEVRECQTRTFEVKDLRLVMKSVLNVLQDDGFMVKNVSLDLGFLSAVKEIGLSDGRVYARRASFEDGPSFGFDLFTGRRMKWRMRRQPDVSRPTHKVIDATVNVSEFGDKVRIRANFQAKVFDHHAAVMGVENITDDNFYQDFFSKVDKGIFLQQQNI